jgi:hypothetical protein
MERLCCLKKEYESYHRIVDLYRERFAKLLEQWEPNRHDEAREMLQRLAVSILSEPPVVKTVH